MALIEKFKTQLPASSYTLDQEIIYPHLKEWRDRWLGVTPFLLMPQSTAEVVKIVTICNTHDLKLCIQGGNTGLVGGQIPQNEILLSTKKLKHLEFIQPNGLIAGSGNTLAEVQSEAIKHQQIFPMSLASEGSATIGGLCATNAGGVHVIRYGNMLNLVNGLEVVLANGKILNTLNKPKKDNTGYQLNNLFIGSEGTLGIITKVHLKLHKPLAHKITLLYAVESPQNAINLYHELFKHFASDISVLELFPDLAMRWVNLSTRSQNPFEMLHPYYLLVQLESDVHNKIQSVEKFNEHCFDKKIIRDGVVASSEDQSNQLMALRENISAAQKSIGHSIKHDISVPIMHTPLFIEKASKIAQRLIPNCRPIAFGHLGDGNIHFNVMQPEKMEKGKFLSQWDTLQNAIHDVVIELNGSIAAEHGLGILKNKEFKSRYPIKYQLNKAIKESLDPNNIFNPRILN